MKQLMRELAYLNLGQVTDQQALGGGSINDAWQVTLNNGRKLFLKTHNRPPSDFFTSEAEGLRTLGATGSIRVPDVVLVANEGLVLEWLEGTPGAHHWEDFGQQLAALHQHTRDRFGFTRDNYCGLTPQPNPDMADGFAFFAEARLLHQGRLARDAGLLDCGAIGKLEWMAARLDRWIPVQPASLIHGDLWSGNAHCGPEGEPVLIDPATHYGWAEADLAMTTLFGRFPAAFYQSYLANSNLSPDWESRIPLYNLYHLLNHLNLFGGGYRQSVQSVLDRYAG